MRENLQCNCHICKIERNLVISLSEPPFSNDFLRLASASLPLEGFSNALALVEHLHSHRDGEKSVPSASEVVGSLMQSSSLISETELRNSVLVLSFVPMIHRTYREVRAWFREIEAEDIAQQILTLFLELVDSAGPMTISNHLPIALTRTLRKNAFRWAEKEKRLTIQREFDKSQTSDEPGAIDTFETVSVLNDFLDQTQFERGEEELQAARANRRQQKIGIRHQEDQCSRLGRFLQDFQENIGKIPAHGVRAVDQKHAAASLRLEIRGALHGAKLPHVQHRARYGIFQPHRIGNDGPHVWICFQKKRNALDG